MLPTMRKAITLILSIALLGVFAAVVVAAMEPSDGTSTLPASSTGTTTEDRTTSTPDISGPCDEAEHANDPRCPGVQAPKGKPAPAPQGGGVDISGPCDEAEHANDPRCTGIGDDRVDNSGPGSVNSGFDDHGDDRFDDHGGDDAFDDHGEDDFDDDSSGSGHRGGGNSGHGGGDD
jgi:hypothetical protein